VCLIHVVYEECLYWLNWAREVTVLFWTHIMKWILCSFRVLYCFTQWLSQEGRSHPIPGQQAHKTAGRQPSWKWCYSHGQYTDNDLECDFPSVWSKWHKVPCEVTISEHMAQHQLQFILLLKLQKHWNQSNIWVECDFCNTTMKATMDPVWGQSI
jgi:hypothetical protein